MTIQNNILTSEDHFCYPTPPEKTAPEYILRRISEHVANGRRECITNAATDETFLYSEIEPISRKFASGLYKLGVRKGDAVIYSTHDSAKVHSFILGVWRANAVIRSSYPEDYSDALLDRVHESKAKVVVCDAQYAKEHVESLSQIPWPVTVIVFGESNGYGIPASTLFEDDGEACPELEVGENDLAMILPTSGTTGNSKGAMYNHRSLIQNLLAYEYLPFIDDPKEASIITSRQTHYIGCVTGMSFIAHGRRLVMMPVVSVENILKAVTKFQVRAILGFPKYLIALVNDPLAKNFDLSSIKYLSTAGQLVGPEAVATIMKLPKLEHFMTVYGMTECGLLGSGADWFALKNGENKTLKDQRPFSVGQIPPHTSLKVLDVDTGATLGLREKGELCFKSPLICEGYLDKPKESAESFQDGWVRTGDVGYYDEDGYIYIVDRHKEIFKYFNNHISPSELESVLLRHPGIAEAVCCGVSDPDGGDFIPRAFVTLKESFEHLNIQEIKEFFDGQVADYKKLRGGLYILQQIPVGKTGKVTRKIMAELPVEHYGAKKEGTI